VTVIVVTPREAVQRTARSLGFDPVVISDTLSSELIAQALRRAVHVLAPCAGHELEGAVVQSLAGLGTAKDELVASVEAILEELVVYGDILEMRGSDDDYWSRSSLVLRPAPPSFVIRTNGSVAILGVAGDEITALAASMAARLHHHGTLRILHPEEGEDLKSGLRELGLLELTESVWLRIPKLESAASHIAEWRQQLAREPASTNLEGVRILDSSRTPTFYRDRWVEPGTQHDGFCIARRPQKYGSALWCIVELEKGVVRRFKDLVAPGDRVRPCDLAWRVQMAIDADAGSPQCFRTREIQEVFLLDFFSPLPSWAERQLAIVGQKTTGQGRLFSYEVSPETAKEEVAFLQGALWLAENRN
jgi:hypothetical protein